MGSQPCTLSSVGYKIILQFSVLTKYSGNPVARTLMRLILGPAAQQLPEPSANDLVPIVDYGVHRYRIQPVLAYRYRLIFDTLAAIVLCAANDHNPYVNDAGP
jgi:hypothetical protein